MSDKNNKLLQPEFKKIKVNNIIAIGGMIAAGKTTLVEDLAKELQAEMLFELDDKDEIQNALLKGLYERRNIPATVFQLYFVLNRFENYKKYSALKNTVIVDRTIFEDRLFAHQNMADDPITFSFYDKIWREKAFELVYSVGVPKIYIILKVDWETFKQRLFKRNRDVEVNNFDNNEDYFRRLNEVYVDFLEKTCQTYGIDYITLDAKMPNDEKIKLIKRKLEEI